MRVARATHRLLAMGPGGGCKGRIAPAANTGFARIGVSIQIYGLIFASGSK